MTHRPLYGPNGGRLSREEDPCNPMDGYPVSKRAAERFLLALEGLDVRVLRLPFVYGDDDAHVAEAAPMMRGFPPDQRLSLGHHVDVAQAVARVLDAPSAKHRLYNVVDDEAPDLATLFASVGVPPAATLATFACLASCSDDVNPMPNALALPDGGSNVADGSAADASGADTGGADTGGADAAAAGDAGPHAAPPGCSAPSGAGTPHGASINAPETWTAVARTTSSTTPACTRPSPWSRGRWCCSRAGRPSPCRARDARQGAEDFGSARRPGLGREHLALRANVA